MYNNEDKIFSHVAQSNAGIIILSALMLVYFHEIEKHKNFLSLFPFDFLGEQDDAICMTILEKVLITAMNIYYPYSL